MDIARARLRNQRLIGAPLKRTADVVRWLAASQAQDFAGAKWALGIRTAGANEAAVERAFNDGAILRTHLLRPTWHFVLPDDIRWLLQLTAPRVQRLNAGRYRDLGLNASTLNKTATLLAKALEGGRCLTRDELRKVIERARVDTAGQRMTYMLMNAELEALICSGPRRGKQFTYALLDERAPTARRLRREDALAELAVRYFASRSPATAHDFAKWSGLTVADARAGLEAAEPELTSKPRRRATKNGAIAHLLSIYDEYISSYRERSAICEPAFGKRLVGMGNALAYVIVVDGRIAGTWQRSFEKNRVEVRLTPFRKFGRAEELAVREAAERFARFTSDQASLDLSVVKSSR